MSILVGTETRLCTSGITGREGTFHTLRNRDYGTQVVAGVTPGKGGQDVDGIPVFNTFHEAADKAGANTAMVFVPPRFAADSILEAEDAGIELIICITEGIPAHDELRVYNTLAKNGRARLVGPNCPGILSPGKANVGIIPAAFFSQGNVGVVSRSGTLTYQIGNVVAQEGFGNSTIVGIGGDPVPGTDFIGVLAMFQDDPETELIVMCGEIGGDAEERAAEFIAASVTKPVVAYIAGFTAPPGKTMGHAGAIVSGSRGSAAAKAQALESKGVQVGRTPTEVAEVPSAAGSCRLRPALAGGRRRLRAGRIAPSSRRSAERGICVVWGRRGTSSAGAVQRGSDRRAPAGIDPRARARDDRRGGRSAREHRPAHARFVRGRGSGQRLGRDRPPAARIACELSRWPAGASRPQPRLRRSDQPRAERDARGRGVRAQQRRCRDAELADKSPRGAALELGRRDRRPAEQLRPMDAGRRLARRHLDGGHRALRPVLQPLRSVTVV